MPCSLNHCVLSLWLACMATVGWINIAACTAKCHCRTHQCPEQVRARDNADALAVLVHDWHAMDLVLHEQQTSETLASRPALFRPRAPQGCAAALLTSSMVCPASEAFSEASSAIGGLVITSRTRAPPFFKSLRDSTPTSCK